MADERFSRSTCGPPAASCPPEPSTNRLMALLAYFLVFLGSAKIGGGVRKTVIDIFSSRTLRWKICCVGFASKSKCLETCLRLLVGWRSAFGDIGVGIGMLRETLYVRLFNVRWFLPLPYHRLFNVKWLNDSLGRNQKKQIRKASHNHRFFATYIFAKRSEDDPFTNIQRTNLRIIFSSFFLLYRRCLENNALPPFC